VLRKNRLRSPVSPSRMTVNVSSRPSLRLLTAPRLIGLSHWIVSSSIRFASVSVRRSASCMGLYAEVIFISSVRSTVAIEPPYSWAPSTPPYRQRAQKKTSRRQFAGERLDCFPSGFTPPECVSERRLPERLPSCSGHLQERGTPGVHRRSRTTEPYLPPSPIGLNEPSEPSLSE